MISLCIPTYNCAEHLPACLDSLLAQRGVPNYELIVVNDGSTDETKAILGRYAARIKTIHLPHNRGCTVARNVGLAASVGDVVGSPDADCVYEPDYVSSLAQALAGNSFAHCNWVTKLKNGTDHVGPHSLREPSKNKLWWWESNLGYPSCLFRRDALEGLWFGLDEWGDLETDRELLLNLAIRGAKSGYVPRNLFRTIHQRPDSITERSLTNLRWRGERVAEIRRRYASYCWPGTMDVVIPGVDQSEMLLNTIDHFRRYSGVNWRLVYVDNGSADGAPEAVEDYCREWSVDHRVIRFPENRGFSVAVNAGIQAADGDCVLIGNNDAWPGPEALERLWRRLLPDVGCVGAVTDDAGSNSILHFKAILGRFGDAATVHSLPVEDIAWRMRTDLRTVSRPMVAFNCALLPRAHLRRVGLLDERTYPDGLAADDAYCRQLRRAGLKVLTVFDSFFRHLGHRTFQSLGLDRKSLQRAAVRKFRDDEQPAGCC